MTFNEERFLSYFLDINSEELVPEVHPDDLPDFESDVEQEGLHVVYSLPSGAKLAVKGLVEIIKRNSFVPRADDLVGPLVDSSSYPPVQRFGIRIYRIRPSKPESWSTE